MNVQVDHDAPRPRVLAIGLTGAEVESLRSVVGSIRTAGSWHSVHYEEHDVLIHTEAGFSAAAGLFSRRIAFANPAAKQKPRAIGAPNLVGPGFPSPTRMHTQFTPAHALELTDAAQSNGLAALVRRSCWPEQSAFYSGFRSPTYPARDLHPLLQERLSDPLVLAGILEESDEEGRVTDSAFWLPDIARSHLVDWVRAAFARWRKTDPDTFPITAEWRHAGEWSSLEELEARTTLSEFDAEEKKRRAEAGEKRRELASALEAAEAAGESWRALISESGDGLVAAVANALRRIGFDVVDSDSLPEHKGKKREDLRVTYGSWIALAEVKGYTGAAKSNDLHQITAAASTYSAENGAQPDALWYVVNVDRELDPAQRETPLSSREEDLESFAEHSSGTLIDTRELFTLRQLVAMDQIAPEKARELLMNADARFLAQPEG